MTEKSLNNTDRLTRQQQKALHLWYRQVADTLNSEGKGMALILHKFVLDVPATPYLIKEMWRILQEGMIGKKSTTELLKKQEIDQIYDALNKFLSEDMQVLVPPFPSLEEQNLIDTYETKIRSVVGHTPAIRGKAKKVANAWEKFNSSSELEKQKYYY